MPSSRSKRHYLCTGCGGGFPKWSGQCPECGAWNTLEEGRVRAAGAAVSARDRGWSGAAAPAPRVVDAASVPLDLEQHCSTGLAELDRVLGGGLVPGAVVLIGGDPGIGKSTLLLQMAAGLRDRGLTTLYVSGEESLTQVGLRAHRLELSPDGLKLLADTSVESILQHARASAPAVLIIDSIQTVYSEDVAAAPGSVSQVRESAARLTRYAKEQGVSVFLVGHVTKEGALAGPRVLEHMVDAVLYFESQADQRFRVVRTAKNRFGAANELGIFAMTQTGLRGVSNPSAIFLSRHPDPVPGSVVTVTREATRPLLVEIQALVDESSLASPRRVAVGLEGARLAMLLAVAHRHAGYSLGAQDVFANVVGGVRVNETGADLPLLLAVLSSFRARVLPRDMVAFGEVGLSGEIRPVPNGEERLQAAAQHGFTTALLPAANRVRRVPAGLRLQPVSRLTEALEVLAGE
jgi:DNA repair protein RadA/Sms